MNLSSYGRQTPFLFALFLGSIIFIGISALLMWVRQRPGEAGAQTVAVDGTPVAAPNLSVQDNRYIIDWVDIEEERVRLNWLANERMIVYELEQKSEIAANSVSDSAETTGQQDTPAPPSTATPNPDLNSMITAVPDEVATNTPAVIQPTQPPVVVSNTPVVVVNTQQDQIQERAYTVLANDTLYSLACDFDSSITMLSTHISADNLIPGNQVTIRQPNPNYCPANAPYEYAVREGDTLFSLGRIINHSVTDIVAHNNGLGTIVGADGIRAGGVICMPVLLDPC